MVRIVLGAEPRSHEDDLAVRGPRRTVRRGEPIDDSPATAVDVHDRETRHDVDVEDLLAVGRPTGTLTFAQIGLPRTVSVHDPDAVRSTEDDARAARGPVRMLLVPGVCRQLPEARAVAA